MGAIRIEVWAAAGYAVFLLSIAAALEWVARHCHERSHRIHTAGFRYRGELDAWECPGREFLTRAFIDPERKLVIYRAPARACNACALKPDCTHSDGGREILAPPESWLQSHIGRFHRGLSLSLCTLAAFLLGVELFRSYGFDERFLLVSIILLIGVLAKHLTSELRSA